MRIEFSQPVQTNGKVSYNVTAAPFNYFCCHLDDRFRHFWNLCNLSKAGAHTAPVRHVEKKWFHTFPDKATNVFCFGTLGVLTRETDWIQGAQT